MVTPVTHYRLPPMILPEPLAQGAPKRASTLPSPSTAPMPSAEFPVRPLPVRRSSAPGPVSQAAIYVALYDTLQQRWGKRAEDLEVRAEWDRIVEASEADRPVVAPESTVAADQGAKRPRDDEQEHEPTEAKKVKVEKTSSASAPEPKSSTTPTQSEESRPSSQPLPHPQAIRPTKASPERTDSLLAVVRSFETMLSRRADMWRDIEKMRVGQSMVRSASHC